jgi:hypothetical protein
MLIARNATRNNPYNARLSRARGEGDRAGKSTLLRVAAGVISEIAQLSKDDVRAMKERQ